MPGGLTQSSQRWQLAINMVQESTYGTTPGTYTNGIVPAGESIVKRGVISERQGIRGTRSHMADDSRQGVYSVAGRLMLEPTPDDLTVLLPWILGGTVTGTTYPLGDTLPSFSLEINRVAKVFVYAGCKVDRATFRGSKGGNVSLALDIAAQSETVNNSGTFHTPTAPPHQTKGPYIFAGDPVLALGGYARETADFELVIDNRLEKDRFMNSLTIVNLPETDRIVTLRTSHAWASQNTDLYDQAVAGAAGTLAFTNGSSSTAFAFADLQVPPEAPPTGNPETMLQLNMMARMTGASKELIVTHSP